MMKRNLFISSLLLLILSACGTMQSIVKSSIPYTCTLVIPATAEVGENHSAIGMASSVDQLLFKKGENVNRINAVKIISAELRAATPADFDLGNLKSVKIYMSKNDDSEAVLVASRANITLDAGNTITLEADNSSFIDRFIREPDVKIKMIYQLRKKAPADASLLLVLNINAAPVGKK